MCVARTKRTFLRIHDLIQKDEDLARNSCKQAEIVRNTFKEYKGFKLVSRVELKIDDWQRQCCGHDMQEDWVCCPYCGQNIVREFLFLVEDDIPSIKDSYKKKKGYELPSYDQRCLKAAFYLEINL
jgi:hypothetical protein